MIKGVNVARRVTVLTKQRSQMIEEVEKLLLIWMNKELLAGDSVSDIICEKARRLHDDLVKSYTDMSADTDNFKASRGWFEKFKKKSGIHSVMRHGEAESVNQEASEEFIQVFNDCIKAEGFISQQVFNCNETSVFWEKIPRRT